MIKVSDFSKDSYDIIHIASPFDLEKKANVGDLIAIHGHVYKIVKLGILKNSYEYVAKLKNVNKESDMAVRTFKYLAKDLPYLIKEK